MSDLFISALTFSQNLLKLYTIKSRSISMSMLFFLPSLCAKDRTWMEFFFSFFCGGWIQMKFALLSKNDWHRLFQIAKITYFPFSVCLSEVAPYLRGGGLGQQLVLEGNRLVLTCLAGGSWPLQYCWTLNNSNITDWTPQYRSVISTGWLCVWRVVMDLSVVTTVSACLPVCLSDFYLRFYPSFSYSSMCSAMPVAWKNSCCKWWSVFREGQNI